MVNRRDFIFSMLSTGAVLRGWKRGADRRRTFLLSATVDFPDDVGFGVYNRNLLEQMMLLLKRMGVRRVYWLYYGDVDPNSDWAGTIFDYMKYGRETLNNVGEPVRAAVQVAHRHGLELYAVLKPYNMGISGTYPEGSPRSVASSVARIGGTLQQVNPFIERNPHLRIRRRPLKAPSNNASQPVRKIRLLKKDDSPTRIKPLNLEFWSSPHNYRYQRIDTQFTLRQSIEASPREVRDYYGDLITHRGAPVRVLTIKGLNLTDKFILVTTNITDQTGDFQNSAVGMLEAYGTGDEPLPIVVATRSAIWESPRDFRTGGLEFDSGYGHFQIQLDVGNSSTKGTQWWRALGGCIAFARGKNEYLPCAPCEVYPEVRKLWLGWIRRLVAAGVDGIDLRISAHGTLTDEPFEYGFNALIVEEYHRRYHTDPLQDNLYVDRLAQLRGAYYTSFLREAARIIRSAGKKIQIHLHTEAFTPNPCHGQLMGIPANIHFGWKGWLMNGLTDGVTLRTSWFEAMEDPFHAAARRSRLSHALSTSVVEEALRLTSALRLPVYLNRYVSRAVGIEEYVMDLERIFRDERFAGFDVYEFAHLARPNPEGSLLVAVKDRMDQIRGKAKDLGIL